ncbi:hypothetical protein DFH11DRAFT_868589 [Phellopilus nigrolimitatus]|nr:hypothetical protein DFH11DRAFT_868589 [Phellopilus nigrolimitatus]
MSDRRSSKKRFRSDGTSIWTRRSLDGPGVWVTCVKGREKQTVGEIYDLFESLAEEIWPTEAKRSSEDLNGDSDAEEVEDLEKAVAKEVEKMRRPRKEQRFASCQTDTPCLVFISCKPPTDPVALVGLHMEKVEKTGITHTRSTQRLIPVSGSCDANLAEITALCKRLVTPAFESEDARVHRYKIELRIRNHNTVSREEVIKTIAQCVPAEHKVDLAAPELFVLVEIFKSTCGISVVRDYYRYKKFNVVEVSHAKLAEEIGAQL